MQRDRLEGYLAQELCLGLALGSKYKKRAALPAQSTGGRGFSCGVVCVRAQPQGAVLEHLECSYQPHTQGLFAFSSERLLYSLYCIGTNYK